MVVPSFPTLVRCPHCWGTRRPGDASFLRSPLARDRRCRSCDFALTYGPHAAENGRRMVAQLESQIAEGDVVLARHQSRLAEWRDSLDVWADYPNVAATEVKSRTLEAFGWAVEAAQWERTIVAGLADQRLNR
jgi:hypothetical protein